MREARHAEQQGGIEGRSVGACKPDIRRQTLAIDQPARRTEHLRRDVDAEEADVGIGARRNDQVARRAAGDFQHPASGRRVQPMDQPVAAEQVNWCVASVDVPLAAVDPVHQYVGRCKIAHVSALEDIEMEAAIDRRPVAGGERP